LWNGIRPNSLQNSQKRNFSASCHPAYEWRRLVSDKALDSRESSYEGSRHFDTLELARGQHKSSHSRRRKRRSFGDAVADTIIFGEHDPPAFTNFDKPNFVFGVRCKVIVVNLDGLARFP
jgi:hypothetical protein